MHPSNTDSFPINCGKKRGIVSDNRELKQSLERKGRGNQENQMTRKPNQKARRTTQNTQSLQQFSHRAIPPLPPSVTNYLSLCTSRPFKHDCCLCCEYQTVGVHKTESWFYILNKFGIPVELWKETNYPEGPYQRGSKKTTREWRDPNYRPLTQFCDKDYPIPPAGGSLSTKPFIPRF